MGIGRLLAALFGLLSILAGAALIAGAIALIGADQDADDFFVSDAYQLETTSFAITGDIDILDDAPAWFVDWFTDVVDVRMTSRSSAGGDLFLGIGNTADVEAYLDGVAFDEITRLDLDPFEVEYRSRDGANEPAVPGTQAFWDSSAEGPGELTMDWTVESGAWSVVVMDAEAGSDVGAEFTFGAKVENITVFMWIALGLGIVLGLVGLAMLFVGIRSPREGYTPTPSPTDSAD